MLEIKFGIVSRENSVLEMLLTMQLKTQNYNMRTCLAAKELPSRSFFCEVIDTGKNVSNNSSKL